MHKRVFSEKGGLQSAPPLHIHGGVRVSPNRTAKAYATYWLHAIGSDVLQTMWSRAPSVFLSDLTKAPVAYISERHMLRRNSLWYLSAESPPRTAPQAPHPRQHTWRLAEKAVCLCVSRNSLNRITKGRVTLLGSSSSECHVCEATWCLRCRTLSRTPPLEFKNTRRLLGN